MSCLSNPERNPQGWKGLHLLHKEEQEGGLDYHQAGWQTNTPDPQQQVPLCLSVHAGMDSSIEPACSRRGGVARLEIAISKGVPFHCISWPLLKANISHGLTCRLHKQMRGWRRGRLLLCMWDILQYKVNWFCSYEVALGACQSAATEVSFHVANSSWP
eukprot:2428659-Amphidinium_carterae.4